MAELFSAAYIGDDVTVIIWFKHSIILFIAWYVLPLMLEILLLQLSLSGLFSLLDDGELLFNLLMYLYGSTIFFSSMRVSSYKSIVSFDTFGS